MSGKTLPSTPADVLQISNAPLRLVVRLVTGLAEVLGFWRYPLKGAATASEEMGPIDSLYWIHKTRNPITRRERSATVPEPAGAPEHLTLPEHMVADESITFGACGDILRSAGIDDSRDVLFANVSDLLFDQDIAFANFESPITTQDLVDEVIGDGGPPVECCSRSQFEILSGHRGKSFNVLNLANNHILDMGMEGIETTLRVLDEQQILGLGLNRSAAEYGSARILHVKGLKIGFVSDNFGLNGRSLPPDEAYRVHVSRLLSKHAPPDTTLLRRQIDDCRERQCDFVFASIHWGFEFEFFPRDRQVEVARSLIEYGADSIICHHPHVIQPVEAYRTRRDPNRQAIIAYSLGSLTWGFVAPHIALSLILNLKLTRGHVGENRVTYVERAQVTPVFRAHVEQDGVPVTRIERLIDHVDAKAGFADRHQVSEMCRFADLVLGTGWRARQG